MLGVHTAKSQKRKIAIVVGGTAALILAAVLVWQTGGQNAVKRSYTPVSVTQTTVGSESAPTAPAQSTTTTILAPKISKGAGSEGIVALSPTSSVGKPTTTAPTSVGLPTTPDTTPGITTTTVPPGATVDYGAQVDPRFVQSPTNPLKVTYRYSASASILSDGQFLPVAVLPSGTLEFFTNAQSGPVCTMPVGGTVTSGTCAVTYSAFGTHSVVANYVVGGNTYVSVILSDDVEPFSTTTVAGISGGGSLGGLVFFAAVTDANGNAVTTGSVSLTIADTTQGWSYVVNGTLSPDGAHLGDFGCVVVENSPRLGEYSGCGLTGYTFTVMPASGDTLTATATYSGIADWGASTSALTTYTMP